MSAIDRVAAFVAIHKTQYDGDPNIDSVNGPMQSYLTLTVADLESLLVDARRYRKLRGIWFSFGVMVNTNTPLGAALNRIGSAGDLETLDEAIDAAMEQS